MLPLEFDSALNAIVSDFNEKIKTVVQDNRNYADQFYIIVVARQEPKGSRNIHQRIVLSKVKPPMMLATMVYFADQRAGKLSRLWTLPGDWPSYPSSKMEEPSPEVVSSIKKVGEHYYTQPVLA